MSHDWTKDLAHALAGTAVETDPDVLEAHARDRAPLVSAGTARALVRAHSVADVVHTLRFAHAQRIPVVTRAAGTGLAGGANAVDGCILLSVAGLDRIVSLDPIARLAVVEPGVLNATLAAQAKAQGLFYAPDPASRDISSLGGNIATNAGGACCMKYGTTGDHVAALQVALADGTLIRTGALTRKNVAGLDLTRLVVGSEGTLGVIVEATLRLLPAPRPASTLVAHFASLQAAGHAVIALDATHPLSLLELMDRTTLRAVEAFRPLGLDTTSAALLIAQSDAPDAASGIEQCERMCRALGASDTVRSDDPAEGSLLLAARRLALPALEQLGMTLLDDVAVPKPALPLLIDRIADIAAKRELVIGTFGHAGDGNLHPTIVFAASDQVSRQNAFAAFDDIVHATLALGGTITGEHGVGTLKTPYLSAMLGHAERGLMQRIKAAFDPHGILNPGKAL